MDSDKKGRVLRVTWSLAGLMWLIFALLFFWIHHPVFGASFLALGLVAFFFIVRWQRQRLRQGTQP
jgi:hypothetical protein